MQICKYELLLLDPLFYSLEGLSGAYTPPIIHATAINFAALNVLNYNPDAQPYFMADSNGGRNIPRYSNSRASHVFYFTPGRLPPLSPLHYLPDLTKGEHDQYLQRSKQGETLKISRLHYIAPETTFEGYLLLSYPLDLTVFNLIRLGSFRGKAVLSFSEELEIVREKSDGYVDHLVDPLVNKVKRGVAKNILPYPVIDSALVENTILCKHEGKEILIGLPEISVEFDPELMNKKLNNLKELLDKLDSAKDKEKCKTLMYILRTSVSIYYSMSGISSEKFINERLREIEGFQELRSAVRENKYRLDHSTMMHLREVVEREINDCKKKIKGEKESHLLQGTGNGSSTIVL